MNINLFTIFFLMLGAAIISYLIGKTSMQSQLLKNKSKLNNLNESLSELQLVRIKAIADNRNMFLKISEQDRILKEMISEKALLEQKNSRLESENRTLLKELQKIEQSKV
jgi:hypothetical protein